MSTDRVNELYNGKIFEPATQQACRERIHWMCSQVAGDDVLDLGCSQGIASILLGREGHRVIGADISSEVIEYAKKTLEEEPEYVRQYVDFRVVGGDRLPFDDASFDTVLLGEVLEHLTRPQRVLKDIQRLLRPDGRVIITTPFGLHPDPGHVRTFYLSSFLSTVGEFFTCDDVSVKDKYIGLVGRPHAEQGRPAETDRDATDMLAISEEAFLAAERCYVEQRETQRSRLAGADQQLTKLRKEAATLERRSADLEASLAAATGRLKQLNASAREMIERMRELLARSNGALGGGGLARRLRQLCETNSSVGEELPELFSELFLQTREQSEKREKTLRADCDAQLAQQARATQQEQKKLREIERKVRAELAANQAQVKKNKAAQASVERTARGLRARTDRQAELVAYFKAESELRHEEVRYQLGDAFVRCFYNPLEVFLLPGRMMKLFARGMSRRRERNRLEKAEFTPRAAAAPPAQRAPATTTPAESVAPSPAVAAEPAPAPEKPKFEFVPVEVPDGPPRLSIKMAAVLDEFTYQCFKPECSILAVTPQDWKQKLETERPDFLFVESAWKGNNGAWQSQLTRAQHIENSPLLEMVEWCKARKIPTVFWNKEDPPNFEHFIYVAKNFDHIFTTDENCIPRYREHVDHDRIYALPFAAQTAIHNPVGCREERYGNLCFAGTYYAKRHASRRGDIDLLLQPALEHGLTIFDRMHGYTKSDYYHFPPEYADAIHGSLSYPEMVDAYKRFNIFLNVNSVTDSPTMFSRRVLELLACGTPVISTYALGIEKLLGRDAVALVETQEDVRRWMDRLLSDTDFADRMVLRGQRRIFSEHTYTHRLRTVLEKIGLAAKESPRRVSVVTCTNRPDFIENIIENYERQVWPEKELVLVLNSDSFNIDDVRRRLASVPDARVFQVPEERSLGECLNRAIDETEFEYWTKFDDDNFHGENFLTDLMAAFTYTDAGVVGKCSYFAHLEGEHVLALRFPEQEHRYVKFLSGSAMIVQRRVLDEVRFPERSVGEDTRFLKDCVEKGFRMYSTDRFNYVVRRAASTDEHTWKIETDEYLKKCRVVARTDDYTSHVVV